MCEYSWKDSGYLVRDEDAGVDCLREHVVYCDLAVKSWKFYNGV